MVKYYYEGYGNLISIIDTSGIGLGTINPFRYRSYYYDNETGWYYLNSRFYDPLIKRFITPDDISYLGASGTSISYNLYSYCENNPIILADYDGNAAKLIVEFDSKHGLPILGHMALLIEDNVNEWHMMEFNKNDKGDPIVRVVDGKDRFVGSLSFRQKVLAGLHISGWLSFDIAGNFNGSLEYAKYNKDKYDRKYNLFTNNCLHFVRDALRHGNADNDLLDLYFMFSTTIVPVVFFNNVRKLSRLNNYYKYSPLIYGGRYL